MGYSLKSAALEALDGLFTKMDWLFSEISGGGGRTRPLIAAQKGTLREAVFLYKRPAIIKISMLLGGPVWKVIARQPPLKQLRGSHYDRSVLFSQYGKPIGRTWRTSSDVRIASLLWFYRQTRPCWSTPCMIVAYKPVQNALR